MKLHTFITIIVLLLTHSNFYILAESCDRCLSLEAKVNKWQVECLDESNAKAVDVLKVRSGVWPVIPTTDGSIQKWSLCILVKAGIMSPHGVFKIDEALNLVPPSDREKALKLIENCLSKIYETQLPSPGGPEIAWRYLRCYNNMQPRKFKIL
ncbi:PBP/GOBP family domain-containing protein [Phthorimaea operculella]|nr:PBP/GOBP family domain-containing protein [Phthorimaea operculella]